MKQREIASEGGRASHEKEGAHEFDSDGAREAGRKGGEAVSSDREPMSEIGRKVESIHRAANHQIKSGTTGIVTLTVAAYAVALRNSMRIKPTEP
jgi:general stress protein YciG